MKRRSLIFLPLIALALAWSFRGVLGTAVASGIARIDTHDFGDAEYLASYGGYPTLLAHNGARHAVGGPWLGDGTDAPDTEPDGQPDATARGDDILDGNDDENGAVIPKLYPGHTSNMQIAVSGGGGIVEVWIDFNNNHQWEHPGERIYAGYLADGTHTIPVAATSSAVIGQTCARFRISTAGGLAPTGEAADGEVEDHAVSIEEPTWDYGDAPDGVGAFLYPTLLMHDGARHLARGPWLGDERDFPDVEADGQPDANGLGDDNAGGDDEDGVQIPPLLPGNPDDITLQVSGGGGYVDAWIDYNGDKTWQHPGERVVSGYYADGIHVVPITVPNDAEPGQTFGRFRISNVGGLPPDGYTDYGEVEDYEVAISHKWEQLPDLDTTGVAVTIGIGMPAYPRIADDFECRQPGYIKEVLLWIAFKDDYSNPEHINGVDLCIYSNLPDNLSPSGYAHPDSELWDGSFFVNSTIWDANIREGWYEGDSVYFPADTVCYLMSIPIPPEESFFQTGTPENPVVYWLQATILFGVMSDPSQEAGWKASSEHWNAHAVMPGCGQWCQLVYPDNHAFSGQQMDMAFRIITEPGLELDWGDAPDDPEPGGYPTLYAHDGARHVIGGPWLGDAADGPDGEIDGQPDPDARGDNTHGDDDENGVQIPVLVSGQNADITIEVSGGGGFVRGWIDFNHDETWDNGTEMVIAQALADGVHVLTIPVPAVALTGPSYARFRISSVGDLEATGRAEDGEVEDYYVTIRYPGTGVDDETVPRRFGLFQSVPNPFNPVTIIRFDVAERSDVRIAVYNVQGRLVRVLVERCMEPGRHKIEWDGKDAAGRSVASGVYFYRLATPYYTESKKMVLLR